MSYISKPKSKKKSRGRQRGPRKGGQPGHEQQLRNPLPPKRVDETTIQEINDDVAERLELTPTGEYEIIQHIELPDTPVYVSDRSSGSTTSYLFRPTMVHE